MAVVILTLVVTSGCAVPGYSERDAMLFEDKIHTEFKAGGFSPDSSYFTGGSGIGVRVNYEYEYGMYFGFEFDTIDDVKGAMFVRTGEYFGSNDPELRAAAIRSVGKRAIDKVNRRALLLNLDWDVPLSKDGNFFLRYGVGIGGLMANTSTSAEFLAAIAVDNAGQEPPYIPSVEVSDQFMFLLRPSASMRWAFADGALALLAEAQYDIVSSEVRIDVDGDGDFAGDVDYGGINAFVGIDYSF
jgi:hypothetical protein